MKPLNRKQRRADLQKPPVKTALRMPVCSDMPLPPPIGPCTDRNYYPTVKVYYFTYNGISYARDAHLNIYVVVEMTPSIVRLRQGDQLAPEIIEAKRFIIQQILSTAEPVNIVPTSQLQALRERAENLWAVQQINNLKDTKTALPPGFWQRFKWWITGKRPLSEVVSIRWINPCKID